MPQSERVERRIIAVLIALLVTGVAVSAVKRSAAPIPIKTEKFDPRSLKPADAANISYSRLNINYAAASELEGLSGIGRTLAARIIRYRDLHGSFSCIDDIKNVKGVSVSVFEKIRDRITVE